MPNKCDKCGQHVETPEEKIQRLEAKVRELEGALLIERCKQIPYTPIPAPEIAPWVVPHPWHPDTNGYPQITYGPVEVTTWLGFSTSENVA